MVILIRSSDEGKTNSRNSTGMYSQYSPILRSIFPSPFSSESTVHNRLSIRRQARVQTAVFGPFISVRSLRNCQRCLILSTAFRCSAPLSLLGLRPQNSVRTDECLLMLCHAEVLGYFYVETWNSGQTHLPLAGLTMGAPQRRDLSRFFALAWPYSVR